MAILLSGLAGAVFTAIPAVLKIKTNSSVLVSSLMLNYLAQWFATFILMHFICDPSIGSGSYLIPEELKLPAMIEKTRIHAGLIIALAAAVLGYFFLYRSRTGYELRLTGQNELFARYSGVSIVKVVLVSQLLGGFIAGVGGGVELLSPIYSRFSWTSLLGYGWDAIIICTLAKNNPLYTPLGCTVSGVFAYRCVNHVAVYRCHA